METAGNGGPAVSLSMDGNTMLVLLVLIVCVMVCVYGWLLR